MLEGEEESGGGSIYKYTEQNPEKLACDAIIVSDTALYNETTPGIWNHSQGGYGPEDAGQSAQGLVQAQVGALVFGGRDPAEQALQRRVVEERSGR